MHNNIMYSWLYSIQQWVYVAEVVHDTVQFDKKVNQE